MSWQIAAAFTPLAISGLLIATNYLLGERHQHFKIFLFIMALLNMSVAQFITYHIVVDQTGHSNIETILDNHSLLITALLVISTGYFIFYYVYNWFKGSLSDDKKNNESR